MFIYRKNTKVICAPPPALERTHVGEGGYARVHAHESAR